MKQPSHTVDRPVAAHGARAHSRCAPGPITRALFTCAATAALLLAPAHAGSTPIVRAPDKSTPHKPTPHKPAPGKRADAKRAKQKKAGRAKKRGKARDAGKPGAPAPGKPTPGSGRAKAAPHPGKIKRPPRLVRPAPPRGDATRGKAAFLALKCQLCHSVQKQGIGKRGGPGSPPDLSTVGSRYTAVTLRDWLRQQPDHRGRKHPFPFNGTPKQLADLIAWLLTLR